MGINIGSLERGARRRRKQPKGNSILDVSGTRGMRHAREGTLRI